MGTGYEVSLKDFVQLLEYPTHRAPLAPIIHECFGYQVGACDGVVIRNNGGQEVSAASMHAAIQSDPERQQRLYSAAMKLWHFAR
jgi:hypothetical protein